MRVPRSANREIGVPGKNRRDGDGGEIRARVSRRWFSALGKPPAVPGALAHITNCRLPADLDAGSSGARAARAGAFTVGDNLDPQRVFAFVVRSDAGLA
jgi:hypothetical protein